MSSPELWDRLLSVLFPKRCVLCGQVVEYDDLWCGACSLPLHHGPCALSADREGVITKAYSPFLYRDNVKQAVLSMKTKKNDRCAVFFAGRMVQALEQVVGDFAPDFVVAVPQTREKQQRIGYNQADLLAEQVALLLGIPARQGILCRTANTGVQHTLSQQERLQNAQASYHLAGDAPKLRGERVLLVDDVLTTGATAAACAHQLLRCGAGSVVALAAAYTPLREV